MNSETRARDAESVRQYLQGDYTAFQTLFNRYERPLYSYILGIVKNRHTAQDLFQQTWYKVIKALPGYEERQKFSSWLFGIAHNCCIDETRKAENRLKDRAKSEDVENFIHNSPTPDRELESTEERELLSAAVEQLSDTLKEVVLLRIKAELPFKEIASVLELPLNTVLGRMHYAVKKLKKSVAAATGGVENVV